MSVPGPSKPIEKPRGRIELIVGCMFSSKTKTLIDRVEKHHYARKQCIIIKHNIDTRYDHLSETGGIICNNGIEYSKIPVVMSDVLSSIDISNYAVIGVMESQFFSDLLIVDSWASQGKIVICDGLDGNSNRDNFGEIHRLMPKCEKIIKLNAICDTCGKSASFTKKIAGLENNNIIDVGGIDKYIPVCRQCY